MTVYSKVAADYIVRLGDTEIYMPVKKDNGTKDSFRTQVLHANMKSMSQYLETTAQSEDGSKYAMNVMNLLSQIAGLFPDKIPKYFEGYKINEDLLKFSHTWNGKEYRTYYPDASIEMWQVEKEPVILFALEQARKGVELPKSWRELQSLYNNSLENQGQV